MENETSRSKVGELRLWIAHEKVVAQARLGRARQALTEGFVIEVEREAARMTGRVAALLQIDALLASEVEIPEPDLPAEPDCEDEAMLRQDLEMQEGDDEPA